MRKGNKYMDLPAQEVLELKLHILRDNMKNLIKFSWMFILVFVALIFFHDLPQLDAAKSGDRHLFLNYLYSHYVMIGLQVYVFLASVVVMNNRALKSKQGVMIPILMVYLSGLLGTVGFVDAVNFAAYGSTSIYVISVFLMLLLILMPPLSGMVTFAAGHAGTVFFLIHMNGLPKGVIDVLSNSTILIFFAFLAIRLRYNGSLERMIQQRVLDNQNQVIANQYSELQKEQENSNRLLLSILPSSVATELKRVGYVAPEQYKSATILFTDFVGFTRSAMVVSPEDLVKRLNSTFLRFDMISEKHGIEKLKTIGDAYMAAGGVPDRNESHAVDVVLACMEFVHVMEEMNQAVIKETGKEEMVWNMRIGINTGSVVAGVIGKTKFAYDIWGDTVNIAARLETACEPGKINVTRSTYEATKDFFDFEQRGEIHTKNRGSVEMFYIKGIKHELRSSIENHIPGDAFVRLYEERFGKSLAKQA